MCKPTVGALAIISAFTAVRIVLMLTLGFGIDEAYTLAHARELRWSYFDHPPLHLWMAYYARLIFGSGPAVRIPFVLLFAGTGWLCFSLTRYLFGARAGLWALFALNASAFFTLSPGGWVVPDGPLLFCLAAAAVMAARILFPDHPSSAAGWWEWSLVGLWLGLAGLSKYSALLFVLGLLIFILRSSEHRFWIWRAAPYVGAVITLSLLFPVLLWNYENRWVSFVFQGGRGLATGRFHFQYVLSIIVGQIALLLPWIMLPLTTAMIQMGRCSRPESPVRFLVCLALPPIVVFTVIPLWGARGLPHWPMPGWFFGFPLLGAWFSRIRRETIILRRWSIVSAGALCGLLLVGVTMASSGWSRLIVPDGIKYEDPTLESFNWTDLREARLLQPAGSRPPAFIIARNWMDGGKIDQALGGRIPVMIFSDDPRQFAFDRNSNDYLGQDGIIIVKSSHAAAEVQRLGSFFESFGKAETLSLGRRGTDEISLTRVLG